MRCAWDDVERGPGDWPKELPTAEQQVLAQSLRWLIERMGPQSLSVLVDNVRRMEVGPVFDGAVVLDWIYACVERAAREVAEPVWRLK